QSPINKSTPNSLFPKFKFKDCHHFKGDFGNNSAELLFEDCSINAINVGGEQTFSGSISFANCKFKPVVSSQRRSLSLSSSLGTTFTNCILYMPTVNGKSDPKALGFYDFMQVNSVVKYN